MRIPPSRLRLLTYAIDFHNKQTALSCTVRRPIATAANVTTNGIAASCSLQVHHGIASPRGNT
jgi:hypothetical protein